MCKEENGTQCGTYLISGSRGYVVCPTIEQVDIGIHTYEEQAMVFPWHSSKQQRWSRNPRQYCPAYKFQGYKGCGVVSHRVLVPFWGLGVLSRHLAPEWTL